MGFFKKATDALGGVNPLSIAGDVISGGISLVNEHKNRDLQKATNYQNYKMFKEGNEFNAEQSKLQRDWSAQQAQLSREFDTSERESQQSWQEKMINQQNDYNSPLNQLRMMQAAGLSPASFDGVVSQSASPSGLPSGSSVGVPSGSSAHSLTPPHLTAPRYDFDLASMRLMNAQAGKLEAETKTENGTRPYVIEGSKVSVDFTRSGIEVNESIRAELQSRVDEVSQKIKESNQRILQSESYIDLMQLQGESLRKSLDVFEDEFKAKMRSYDDSHRLADAQIDEISSKIRLNLASAAERYQQAALNHENMLSASYSNFYDGLKLSALSSDKKRMVEFGELMYNSDRDSYQFSISHNASVLQGLRYENQIGKYDSTKKENRMKTGWNHWYNYPLDILEYTGDALSGVFSGSVSFSRSVGSKAPATRFIK